MIELEREVIGLIRGFVSDITNAAQRAVIQTVQSAFARTSQPAAERRDAVATAGDSPTRSVRVRRLRKRTDRAALISRAIAAIREHPGATTAELGQVLGMRADTLRPYLQQLVDGGTVRFEETQLGGLRRRAYFSEHVNGHAEAPIVPAGASA